MAFLRGLKLIEKQQYDNFLKENDKYKNIKLIRDLTNAEINNYRKFLETNHYLLIKNILTKEAIDYFTNYITFDPTLGVHQFGRQHNSEGISELIVRKYFKESFNLYKKILGDKFYRTYTFAMKYNENNECIPHLDLVHNEISATTCYKTDKDYPIYMSKKYIQNYYGDRYTDTIENINQNDIIEINIQVGDIAFFNGRNHLHFRKKLEEDIDYRAILTHYSKTKAHSNEWKQKTSVKVPFINSNEGPYYKRSFT